MFFTAAKIKLSTFIFKYRLVSIMMVLLLILTMLLKTSNCLTVCTDEDESSSTKSPDQTKHFFDFSYDSSYNYHGSYEDDEATTPKPPISHCTLRNLTDQTTVEFPFNEQITRIDAKNSNLSQIPYEMFSQMPSITFVQLQFSGISVLYITDFFGAMSLQSLNLSHNRIELIDNYVFENALSLTTVDLSFNKIASVSADAFQKADSLQELHLTNNRIKTFSCRFSAGTMRVLQLSHNPLQTIDSSILSILQTLSISFTELTALPPINFTMIPYLDVGDNAQLNGTLSDFRHTQKLIVRNTSSISCIITPNLILFDASRNRIDSVIVEASDSYEILALDLSHNALKSMSNLTVLSSLIGLDLSHNFITDIDVSSFSAMPKLSILLLANSGLFHIDYGLFSNLARLQWLDISENRLTEIDLNMFRLNSAISKLLINKNQLTTLAHDRLNDILPSLKEIDVNDNNFDCSNLTDIIQTFHANSIDFVLDSKGRITNGTNVLGIVCHQRTSNDTIVLSQTNSMHRRPNEIEQSSLDRHERRIDELVDIVRNFTTVRESMDIVNGTQVQSDLERYRQEWKRMETGLMDRIKKQKSRIMLNARRLVASDTRRKNEYLRFQKRIESSNQNSFIDFLAILKRLTNISEILTNSKWRVANGRPRSDGWVRKDDDNINYVKHDVLMEICLDTLFVMAVTLLIVGIGYLLYYCVRNRGTNRSTDQSLQTIRITQIS